MKKYNVNVNGFAYEVEIEEVKGDGVPSNFTPATPRPTPPASRPQTRPPKVEQAPVAAEGESINAPMQGKIIEVKVAAGDSVMPGQLVAVLEAMKMENDIVASEAGTVTSVAVSPGQSVDAGDVLIKLG